MPGDARFHVDDPRFSERREEPGSPGLERQILVPPVKRRSLLSSCMIGCLVMFVVLAVVVGIIAYWISQNWREWASSLGADVLKEGINATELPEAEKVDIEFEIDRLAAALRDGRLSGRQMQFIVDQVSESPLMTTLVASAIEKKYLAGSGLNEAEKTDGRQTIRRFLRGAIDGQIAQQGIDDAMTHVATRRQGSDWELKDQLSDEDLRAFLAEAKQQADAAEIPNEAEDVDPSDEFKRIVDEALQGP